MGRARSYEDRSHGDAIDRACGDVGVTDERRRTMPTIRRDAAAMAAATVMPLPTAPRASPRAAAAGERAGRADGGDGRRRSRRAPARASAFAAELADVGRAAAMTADAARAARSRPADLRIARARRRRGRQPARGRAAAGAFSYSSLSTLRGCPLQYAFQLRLPDPASRSRRSPP